MTRILREADVRPLVGFPEAIDVVARGVVAAGNDEEAAAERSTLTLPAGWLRVMSGSLPSKDLLGYKAFHLTPGGVHYLCALYRLSSGEPLALVDANFITLARTSATAAAAAAHYWGDVAIKVAVIGSGLQARQGLIALHSACRVEGVRLFSRNQSNRERYAADLQERLQVTIEPASSAGEATKNADMILCATQTRGQIALPKNALGPARYISSISSTLPSQRELDEAIIAAAGHVIIDTADALDESGDLLAARRSGLERSRVERLSRFLGRKFDREDAVTVYKSIGSIEQDLALAVDVWERADSNGIGEVIEPIERAFR